MKMPQIPHGEVIGKPDGSTPSTEAEHFLACPVCGQKFDMRDLGQALEHWHDGPSSMVVDDEFFLRIYRGRSGN
jgi:hypothetical protein